MKVYKYCFFFKQKTAYEMRISDWSSDVCSSDLHIAELPFEFDARERLDGIMDGCGIGRTAGHRQHHRHRGRSVLPMRVHRLIEHVPVGSNSLQALFLSDDLALTASDFELPVRSEEHTSELQSLMRISYAVFCFQK